MELLSQISRQYELVKALKWYFSFFSFFVIYLFPSFFSSVLISYLLIYLLSFILSFFPSFFFHSFQKNIFLFFFPSHLFFIFSKTVSYFFKAVWQITKGPLHSFFIILVVYFDHFQRFCRKKTKKARNLQQIFAKNRFFWVCTRMLVDCFTPKKMSFFL